MIVLNLIVISRLRKSKKTVNVAKSTNLHATDQRSEKQFRFQVSMVIVDFTFLIFYTPRAISLTLGMIDLLNGMFSSDPVTNALVNTLSFNITQLLAQGYSTFMILFFIIFNRIFRKELLRMFCLEKVLSTFSEKHSSTAKLTPNNQTIM